jgi:hypothetical protein
MLLRGDALACRRRRSSFGVSLGCKVTQRRSDSAFAARPREHMASLAVQCAFEHIEQTCMSDSWWSDLKRPMRAALLERARRANSLAYRRSPRCLSYRLRYADWPVADVR